MSKSLSWVHDSILLFSYRGQDRRESCSRKPACRGFKKGRARLCRRRNRCRLAGRGFYRGRYPPRSLSHIPPRVLPRSPSLRRWRCQPPKPTPFSLSKPKSAALLSSPSEAKGFVEDEIRRVVVVRPRSRYSFSKTGSAVHSLSPFGAKGSSENAPIPFAR